MKIQFLGAAKNVTGSCYYVETEHEKFLVDCGQFQGDAVTEKENQTAFPFDPSTLDFILLTHAHIDHTGRLPKLVQGGFKGIVYLTRGTASLSELLLLDSAKIHEYENELENEKRVRAGLDEVPPFYSQEDAINTLQYFYPVPYEKTMTREHLSFRFINAGHLLGSSHIYIETEGKSLLFSGDIGSSHSQILQSPKPAVDADYVFMESTYGAITHKNIDDRFAYLYELIKETTDQKGTVIIPAFSVGRTQDILYGLKDFVNDIDFYVDSPMAIHATKVFTKDTEGMLPSVVEEIESGKPFEPKHVTFVDDAKASFKLNFNTNPKVLISASGMCDAGRILHHLKAYLEKEKTNVIFVGYQSEESLGRKIQSQLSEIDIKGEMIKNKAQIHTLHGFSGHADQNELVDWIKDTACKKVFIVHGETLGINALSLKLNDLGFDTYVPEYYEVLEL